MTNCSFGLDVPSDCCSNSQDGNNGHTDVHATATNASANNGMQQTSIKCKRPLDDLSDCSSEPDKHHKQDNIHDATHCNKEKPASHHNDHKALPTTHQGYEPGRGSQDDHTANMAQDRMSNMDVPGCSKPPGHRAATNATCRVMQNPTRSQASASNGRHEPSASCGKPLDVPSDCTSNADECSPTQGKPTANSLPRDPKHEAAPTRITCCFCLGKCTLTCTQCKNKSCYPCRGKWERRQCPTAPDGACCSFAFNDLRKHYECRGARFHLPRDTHQTSVNGVLIGRRTNHEALAEQSHCQTAAMDHTA